MAKKGRKKAAPKLSSRPEDAGTDADKRFKEQQQAFSDQEGIASLIFRFFITARIKINECLVFVGDC